MENNLNDIFKSSDFNRIRAERDKLTKDNALLIEALEEVLKEYISSLKLIADIGKFTYSDNRISIKAKELLNNLKK